MDTVIWLKERAVTHVQMIVEFVVEIIIVK
jgi:hypothetical protein